MAEIEMAPAIVSGWGQRVRDVGEHLHRTKQHVGEACQRSTSVLGGYGALGAIEGADATLQLTAGDLAGAMRTTGDNFTASAAFVRTADAASHGELAGIPERDLQPITVNVPLAEFPWERTR